MNKAFKTNQLPKIRKVSAIKAQMIKLGVRLISYQGNAKRKVKVDSRLFFK